MPGATLPLDPDTRPPHARPALWLAVAVGAVPGTLARYALSRTVTDPARSWPTATFVTNLLGAFALGLLLEALVRHGDDTGKRQVLRLMAGTGFLGSFTTYSTLAVGTDLLLRAHCPGIALGYAAASVAGGTLCCLAGILLSARIFRAKAVA